MTFAKPIQKRLPFHNEALVMNQTTNADFEPIPHHSATSLKIKIRDITLDSKLGTHFALGNIYSPDGVLEKVERNEPPLPTHPQTTVRNVFSKVASPAPPKPEEASSTFDHEEEAPYLMSNANE